MEARLGAALPGERSEARGERAASPVEDASEAVAATSESAPNAWPDESAEAAMMSELRVKGEMATPTATEMVEEIDTEKLPPLDELVKRLSPEVRETLDALFRARFIAVRRVPQKALQK